MILFTKIWEVRREEDIAKDPNPPRRKSILFKVDKLKNSEEDFWNGNVRSFMDPHPSKTTV